MLVTIPQSAWTAISMSPCECVSMSFHVSLVQQRKESAAWIYFRPVRPGVSFFAFSQQPSWEDSLLRGIEDPRSEIGCTIIVLCAVFQCQFTWKLTFAVRLSING